MILEISVKPNSKVDSIQIENGQVKVRIKAPPVDGKANEYLIRFLSDQLNIPRSKIQIKKGGNAKLKLIEIDGDEDLIKQKLFPR